MRNFVILFLLFLYMIPAIGISITAHYCGGRLASVSIGISEDKCTCGNKKMKRDCCKTKTAFVKLCEVHKTNPQLHLPQFNEIQNHFFYPLNDFYIYQSESSTVYNYTFSHPPNYTEESIYLVNRVFRI